MKKFIRESKCDLYYARQAKKLLGWSNRHARCYVLAQMAKRVFNHYNDISDYENIHRIDRWLVTLDDGKCYFDFGQGGKLPDIRKDVEKYLTFARGVFEDSLLLPALHGNGFPSDFVRKMDAIMGEGSYGYVDGNFDVRVKQGDVVIDAGAWIGDFSCYASAQGASAIYAFEPTSDNYEWLCQTAELNDNIVPVKKGLSDMNKTILFSLYDDNSGKNRVANDANMKGETVELITLDEFVAEQKLERVDFIKSDIEGAERDLLRGAAETLRCFAPKLALCTYHLPDDPEVMSKIILECNPDYTIVQLRHKLFAAVVKG